MSVQIYKDGKLTPVAGELYESGNVVPLANHANTANTANKADSANRALTDGRGYEISRTYMPRGIDFKNGLIYTLLPSTGQEETWTATEDCFMTCSINADERIAYLYIDGTEIIHTKRNVTSYHAQTSISIPVLAGQIIRFKSTYNNTLDYVGCRFYRYIY